MTKKIKDKKEKEKENGIGNDKKRKEKLLSKEIFWTREIMLKYCTEIVFIWK